MVFTDKFIYIHEPKTGGTFVREVLFRVHLPGREAGLAAAMQSLVSKATGRLKAKVSGTGQTRDYQTRYGPLTFWENKHGIRSEIPKEHREKVILATVRNPYDLYVSEFEFGWWKKPRYHKDFRSLPGFSTTYAHFPNLTFEEYVRLLNPDPDGQAIPADGAAPIGVGAFSRRFAKFYCRNPQEMMSKLDDEYIADERYRQDLLGIKFITTDRLNVDLQAFLLEMGYRETDVRFIRELGKIRPDNSQRRDDQRWEDYFTPELKQLVRERERMLFSLFPQFDV